MKPKLLLLLFLEDSTKLSKSYKLMIAGNRGNVM